MWIRKRVARMHPAEWKQTGLTPQSYSPLDVFDDDEGAQGAVIHSRDPLKVWALNAATGFGLPHSGQFEEALSFHPGKRALEMLFSVADLLKREELC